MAQSFAQHFLKHNIIVNKSFLTLVKDFCCIFLITQHFRYHIGKVGYSFGQHSFSLTQGKGRGTLIQHLINEPIGMKQGRQQISKTRKYSKDIQTYQVTLSIQHDRQSYKKLEEPVYPTHNKLSECVLQNVCSLSPPA